MDRLLERERKLRQLNEQLDARKSRAESHAAQVLQEQEAYFQRMAGPALEPLPQPEAPMAAPEAAPEQPVLTVPATPPRGRTPLRTAARPTTGAVFATATPGSPASSTLASMRHSLAMSPPQSSGSPHPRTSSGSSPGSAAAAMAQVSVLTRELQAMQQRLESVMAESADKDRMLAESEAELKTALDENRRAARAEQALKTAATKAQKVAEEARRKAHAHALKASSLQSELDKTVADSRARASKATSADVRLNRALEEAEKVKAELAEAQAAARDDAAKFRRELADRDASIKRLSKQRTELLAAFKKQPPRHCRLPRTSLRACSR
ncbi:testis-expressed sequence 9 protein [Thecamonas trahens ATCC 50062]|uniref:Testis-expressed sequence 9 protein n=1 Tax=Thecamonas trahens ATCC 50062 TaxID=461836 RepID=A0A0L0DQ67_THETB|nr:testis-expressed sequence 9 protein [Thecamonas trahens ATCC 50062]KNC54161.1 testis-expressed sequence 9 protein [Thecamonas trahens ATCC 50062]|eukprot:XP_013753981.1 testis-expressed sequence 9 protein [Thecamonas trahens ATCC 50062]